MEIDLEPRLVQRVLFPPSYCSGCLVGPDCTEQHTDLGCSELGPPDPSILHVSSTDWLSRFAEVNTFDLNVQAMLQELPDLPNYVPAIRPTEWGRTPPHSDVNALAIRLADVESLARRAKRLGSTARDLLGLSRKQQLLVLGFASDQFLEDHWPESRRRRLLTAIKEIDPDAAIAWNYSVWHRHAHGWTMPRMEQMYSLKRSLKVYAEMQALNIPAIPHIYWGVPDDLDRWTRWIADNPAVEMFAVDLQTLDHDRAWRRALEALASFRRKLGPRQVHAVFSGVCLARRVEQLKNVWPDSSLTNLGAHFSSGCFRFKSCYGLSRPWLSDSRAWTRQEVFDDIVRQYSSLFDDRSAASQSMRSVS